MYNTLLRLYQAGKITESGLTNAVTKGWITTDEKARIIASVSE